MRIDREGDVLLVVDLQHDFLPGGALGVAGADAILDPIALLAPAFDTVVLTQDFHPPGHVSFASAHSGRKPFEVLTLPQGEQELWPDHCVRGTRGADLHPSVRLHMATLLLRKGTREGIDSYSAFRENAGPDGRRPPTGLAGWLRERGARRVFICGLARDFCVRWSAEDAVAAGFESYVLDDLTRAVFPDRQAETDARLEAAGARCLQSDALRR